MSTTQNPTTITAQPGTPFVDLEREFDATPDQVFRASSDPELVAQWLGPRELETTIVEYDVRSGGRYRYVQHAPGGGDFGFHGVFHSVEPGVRVIQTFEFEGAPGQVSLETATYEDLGNGRTRFHSHSIYPSVETRDMVIASGMERGVIDSMDRLAEILARD